MFLPDVGERGVTRAIASPSVRALAARTGVDLDGLAEKLGRETLAREDVEGLTGMTAVLEAVACWDVDHAEYGPVSEAPLSRMAQTAARNLAAAQVLVPAVTHHDEADVSAIEAIRKSFQDEAAEHGVKLTALTFHVVALARCLKAFPRFNASLRADGQTLVLKHYCHIGVAVDTAHGLVVPVIRDADKKGFFDIATEISDLASAAQERKLRPEKMGGASMTITNLGGIGGTAFSPIVNPPEVAILGISRTRVTPVWDGESFQPVPAVPLDLSYDHRVINGAEAARFLAFYVDLMTEPHRLLL